VEVGRGGGTRARSRQKKMRIRAPGRGGGVGLKGKNPRPGRFFARELEMAVAKKKGKETLFKIGELAGWVRQAGGCKERGGVPSKGTFLGQKAGVRGRKTDGGGGENLWTGKNNAYEAVAREPGKGS